MSIGTVLLVFAFICFVLSACNVPRANWLAIGLASWVLASLVGGFVR